MYMDGLHAQIQKIFSVGVQIPRRGLTENFNMAKINNLAIPGGVQTTCPPSGSAHGFDLNHFSWAGSDMSDDFVMGGWPQPPLTYDRQINKLSLTLEALLIY